MSQTAERLPSLSLLEKTDVLRASHGDGGKSDGELLKQPVTGPLGNCMCAASGQRGWGKDTQISESSQYESIDIYIYILEAKGGAKASAPEWESGGQRGRKKHGALFGGSRTE